MNEGEEERGGMEEKQGGYTLNKPNSVAGGVWQVLQRIHHLCVQSANNNDKKYKNRVIMLVYHIVE